MPTTKLTFANGQFVDLTTEEGRKIAESSAAREKDADEPSHEGCVRGVEYALTPQWRLTADARWMRVGTVRLDNETGNPGGSASQLKYNPLSVQVGLRYNF